MGMRYTLFLEPEVHAARERLPGHIRQRVRRAIEDMAEEPRPPDTRALDMSSLELAPEIEVRRLRLESWRLVYAVNDTDGWVWILGLHRRPPYDYADLPAIVRKLQS